MRVTIIGIGGIGSHLAGWVARFLAWRGGETTLTLVDGDSFEDRNQERQEFDRPGNKAQVVVRMLAERYPGLRVETIPEFLSPENSDWILPEDEIVLVCVDNHKTRKLVADVAATRANISVISGGNDLEYGTVLISLRRGGKDVTPPLTQDRPEIANPADRAPFELNCEERAAAGAPQVLCANLTAAVLMLNAFWRLVTDPDGFVTKVRGEGAFKTETAFTEVHFDVFLNRVMPRQVAVKINNVAQAA